MTFSDDSSDYNGENSENVGLGCLVYFVVLGLIIASDIQGCLEKKIEKHEKEKPQIERNIDYKIKSSS